MGAHTVEITTDNFDAEVIRSDKLVLIDFWAEWCVPCKMIGPLVDEIAAETPAIKVGKCNIDENNDIAINFKISSIPTLLFFKGGQVVDQIIGAVPKTKIQSILSSLL